MITGGVVLTTAIVLAAFYVYSVPHSAQPPIPLEWTDSGSGPDVARAANATTYVRAVLQNGWPTNSTAQFWVWAVNISNGRTVWLSPLVTIAATAAGYGTPLEASPQLDLANNNIYLALVASEVRVSGVRSLSLPFSVPVVIDLSAANGTVQGIEYFWGPYSTFGTDAWSLSFQDPLLFASVAQNITGFGTYTILASEALPSDGLVNGSYLWRIEEPLPATPAWSTTTSELFHVGTTLVAYLNDEGTSLGRVITIDSAAGRVVWTENVTPYPAGIPDLQDAYASALGGDFFRLNVSHGYWELEGYSLASGVRLFNDNISLSSTSSMLSLLAGNGVLLVYGTTSNWSEPIIAYSLAGAKLWIAELPVPLSFAVGGVLTNSPSLLIVSGGNIFAASVPAGISAAEQHYESIYELLNDSTGELVWEDEYSFSATPSGVPTLYDPVFAEGALVLFYWQGYFGLMNLNSVLVA